MSFKEANTTDLVELMNSAEKDMMDDGSSRIRQMAIKRVEKILGCKHEDMTEAQQSMVGIMESRIRGEVYQKPKVSNPSMGEPTGRFRIDTSSRKR